MMWASAGKAEAAAWSWTFGDGGTSLSRNPTHTYAAAGPYTVTLVASNDAGSSAPVSQTVDVGPQAQAEFGAIADGYVVRTSPDANYGRATNLHVKTSSSNEKRAFLKFSVGGMQGLTVTGAKLRLYVTDPSPTGGSVYPVDPGWIESGPGGLTWNNQPAIAGPPLAAGGPAGLGGWLELDVAAAIDGDGTYAFAVVSPSSDTVYYASRESANPPRLVVTFR